MRHLLLLVALSTSLPAAAGVLIGNPPSTRWSFATESTADVSLRAEVEAIELYGCDAADDTWVDLDAYVDFAAGFDVDLPVGDWCAMSVVLSSALERCTTSGCTTESPAYLDLTSEDGISLRGVLIGNPPVRALPTP